MKILLIALLTICFNSLSAQQEITLEQVKDHVGDSVKVSGKISGVKYLQSAKGSPTFINVGGAYPNQLLTLVIWGDVRATLGYDPGDENNSKGFAKIVGKIELYKGKPQIVIYKPEQLMILVDEEVPASELKKIKTEQKESL